MMGFGRLRFVVFGTLLVGLCMLLRASTLEISDLVDPTEARYAAVAQEMVYSSDWLTPKLPMPSGIIPYMGKPPLHFWWTALTYSIFGVDEWTARLPSFLAALVILGSLIAYGRFLLNTATGVLASLIAISSGVFFFFSGASVIDVTLSACIAVAMLSFALLASGRHSRDWGLLFFVAIALGFLTKGPIALALVGLPIGIWIALTQNWRLLRAVPWIKGALIFFALTIPWFVLQERANPGFLNYFFLTENIGRYLVKDFGDRYGNGHVYPRGSVWWMIAVATLPWSLFLIWTLARKPTQLRSIRQQLVDHPWVLYSLLWGISPAIFFTFVRQLHIGYVLPGIAGTSLALAWLMNELSKSADAPSLKNFGKSLLVLAFTLSLATAALGLSGFATWHASALALVCLMIVMVTLLIGFRSKSTTLNTLALSALGLVGAFSTVIVVFAAYADSVQSSGPVLREISVAENSPTPIVGIINNNTFSHYFLARAWKQELQKPIQIVYIDPALVSQSPVPNLLIKQRDLKDLTKDTLAGFTKQFQEGEWIWFRRKT